MGRRPQKQVRHRRVDRPPEAVNLAQFDEFKHNNMVNMVNIQIKVIYEEVRANRNPQNEFVVKTHTKTFEIKATPQEAKSRTIWHRIDRAVDWDAIKSHDKIYYVREGKVAEIRQDGRLVFKPSQPAYRYHWMPKIRRTPK